MQCTCYEYNLAQFPSFSRAIDFKVSLFTTPPVILRRRFTSFYEGILYPRNGDETGAPFGPAKNLLLDYLKKLVSRLERTTKGGGGAEKKKRD